VQALREVDRPAVDQDPRKLRAKLAVATESERDISVYVIRRVWAVLPREARRAATIVADMAQRYEESGQRSDVRVYFNGGTLPGEKDRVYMEWLAEAIESPYRAGNEIPQEARDLSVELRELTTDSWIEFNELFTPDKAQRD
jgi:hypothetical protein